tara:strand:+ start:863 stop:2734 length:1872 start_codon:yes stop_codon:yes gene_type:complete
MSSPDINYPEQPSYGEGMAEALKAQAEFLKGTGDFAGVGSMESLLPLEESLRKKTAQADTDVLRQTLLGGETKSVSGTYDDQGRLVVGQRDVPGKATTKKVSARVEAQLTYRSPQNTAYNRWTITARHPQTGAMLGSSTHTGSSPHDAKQRMQQQHASKKYDIPGDVSPTTQEPVFAEDPDGNIITDPSKAGQTETIPASRLGDGMVDLLGDRRAVQEFETKTATQADVDAGLATEVGDSFVAQRQTQRQAGFDDTGNFMGLAAMAEDIQRGNLSRQREADLQDVSRLSGLYGEIMEDYKPGTTSAMKGAKDLIEGQKDNLLRDVGISDPEKVASQGVQADPLRQGLMTQAQEALGQGLTDREERQVAEAARARSTMMGRTFDQSGAIAEAEARVLEDNQRKMQNRAFAQQVLGQEAGIQTADDTRRLGADQFNVGAQMDAERAREGLRQQGLLGYLDAASRVSQIENQESMLDPFQAILGRGGGTSLQQGQSVFGQAGYGLQSQPQYLNPEAGLGYIQTQATNAANMYGAQQSRAGAERAGLYQGVGNVIGGGFAGLCWVAREVYGLHNPAWLQFREWMLNESPSWFRTIYIKFGERFAKFISNKPRLKARIRTWMDTKIGR